LVFDAAQLAVSPSTLTFTTGDWSAAQTVTVTAVNDDLDEDATHTENIVYAVASTDTNYDGLSSTYFNEGAATVAVDIADDDTAGVTISTTALALAEGSSTTAAYTIVLDSEPRQNVRVSVAANAGICATTAAHAIASATAVCSVDGDCASGSECLTGTSVTLSAAYLDFTSANWDTPQTITVSVIDDYVRESSSAFNGASVHTASLTHTSASDDAHYASPATPGTDAVTVSITDNDEPTVFATVNDVVSSTYVAGATATLTFTLVCTRGLAAAAEIHVWLPSTYVAVGQASDLTAAAVSGFDGTLAVGSLAGSGYNVAIARAGGAGNLAPGTTVVFTLAGVTNPQRAGAAGAFPRVATTLADPGHNLYGYTAAATLAAIIDPAAFATPPTLTLSGLVAGDVVMGALAFTTTNPIPADGGILLTLPSTFTSVESSPTISAASNIDGTLTASTSGLTVTITRSGGSAVTAGIAVGLTISGIELTQYVTTTAAYPTLRTLWSGGLAAVDEASAAFYSSDQIAAVTTTYGYFGSPTPVLTPNTLVAGDVGSAVLTFTLKNPLPSNGRIALRLPTTFGLSAVTGVTASSGVDGTFAAMHTAHGHDIIATRQGDGSAVPSDTAITIALVGVANPIWSGASGAVLLLRTELNDGTVIDEASSGGTYASMVPPALTFTPGSFTGVPTVVATSDRAGDVVNLTVTFTAANSVPNDGIIILDLPTNYLIEDSNLGVWTTGCNETLTGAYEVGYRGCQTKTISGKECQAWDVQTPHTHTRTVANYPNGDLTSNICRNPDDWNSGIWCYTNDPHTRFEACDPVFSSGLDGTYAITASGSSGDYSRSITVVRQGDGTPTMAGQVLSITLRGIRNQRYSGLTGNFDFMRTTKTDGTTIDEASASYFPSNRAVLVTDVMQPGDLVDPTVHFESRVSRAEVNGFVLRFVAANPIPVGGSVILTLPPAFEIDASTLAVIPQAAGDSPATMQVALASTNSFGGTTVVVTLTSSDSNAIDAVSPGDAVALAFTGTIFLAQAVEVSETFHINTTLADGETVVDVAPATPGWAVRHLIEQTSINSTIVGVEKYIHFSGRNISSHSNDSVAWVPHGATNDADCNMANFIMYPVQVSDSHTALITFPHGTHCPTEALTYHLCYRFGSVNNWKLYRGFELLVRDVLTMNVASGFMGANTTAVAGARKEFEYTGVGLADGDVLRYISAAVVAAAAMPGNSVCDDAAAGTVVVAAEATVGSSKGILAWKDLAGGADAYRLCYEFSLERNNTKHKLLSPAFAIKVHELVPGFAGASFSSVQGQPRPAVPLNGFGAVETDHVKWIVSSPGDILNDASCGTGDANAADVRGTDEVNVASGVMYNSVPLDATPLTAHNVTFHAVDPEGLHLCYKFTGEAYRLYGNITMLVQSVSSVAASVVGADGIIVAGQPKSFTFAGPGVGAHVSTKDSARWVPMPYGASVATAPGHANATAASFCGDAVAPWASSAQVDILSSGASEDDFTIPDNGTYALCYAFAAYRADDARSGVDTSAKWAFQIFPARVMQSHEVYRLHGRDFGEGTVAVVDYPKAFAVEGFGVAAGDEARWVNATVRTDADCNHAISASGELNLFSTSQNHVERTSYENQVNVFEAGNVSAGLVLENVEFKTPSADGLPWVLCYRFGLERWRAYPTVAMIASRVDLVSGTQEDGIAVNISSHIKPVGSNVRIGDRMKWVLGSASTDAACSDYVNSLGLPISSVPGTVSGGTGGIGGVINIASLDDGASVAFTLASPVGEPWKLCYAFGSEPFKLYANHRLDARAVLSMQALAPAGSAPGVVVVGRPKTFELYGSGLQTTGAVVDKVAWIPHSIFHALLTRRKTRAAGLAASNSLHMTEGAYIYLDLVCDELDASQGAITLHGGDQTALTNADYSTNVFTSATDTSVAAFSLTTVVASPRDEPYVMCYRMRGAPNAMFVPHIQLYSRTLLPAALSVAGAVALQPKDVTLSLSGNGSWIGDRVRFASSTATSDADCQYSEPSTYLLSSAPEWEADGGTDLDQTSTGPAVPLTLTFAAPLADSLKLCVRFGSEPYALFATSTVEVKGIVSTNNTIAVVGSTMHGRFRGFGMRDSVDSAMWVESSVVTNAQCGSAAPFGNSSAGLISTYDPTTTNAITESIGAGKQAGWTQWRFGSAAAAPLRLCYHFQGEEWTLYSNLEMRSLAPSVKSLSPDRLIVGLAETLVFTGDTIGATQSHRFKFVANDAVSCTAVSEGGVGIVEVNDPNFGVNATLSAAGVSAVVTTTVPSASVFKPWRLCFAFGDGPLSLVLNDVDIASVELTKIVDASETCETQIGVASPFKFEGTGVADGDAVKFVSSVVATDAQCAGADAVGGAQLVVNEGASFIFTGETSKLQLCYRFGATGSPYRLYKSLPMRCTPSALAATVTTEVEAEENAETSVEMRMSGDVATIENKTKFGEDFAAGVAAALGVPVSRIVVQAVTSGSIIVNFIIAPPQSVGDGSTASATAALPTVAELVAELTLQVSSNTSKLNAPGALPASIDTSYTGGALGVFIPKAEEESTISLVVTQHQSSGLFAFSSGSASVTEDSGVVVLNVTRGHGTSGRVYVAWSCTAGTARRNVDFTCDDNGGYLWFNDGQKSALLSIPIIDDDDYEAHYESFSITLSVLPGQPNIAVGSLKTATVLIYDYGDGVSVAGVAPATWGVRSGDGAASTLLDWALVGNGGAGVDAVPSVDSHGVYGTDASYGRSEYNAACDAASDVPCTHSCTFGGAYAPAAAAGPGVAKLDGAALSAIVLPDFGNFPANALTVSLWLRAAPATTGTVLSFAATAPIQEFALHMHEGRLCVLVHDRLVGVRRGLCTGITVADGTLRHISASWRSADGAVQVWIDGRLAWTGPGPYRAGRVLSRTGTLVIGQHALGACGANASAAGTCAFDGARSWAGDVQNVRVWSLVLPAARRAADVRWPFVGSMTGLLLNWRVESALSAAEGAQPTLVDSSPMGNHTGVVSVMGVALVAGTPSLNTAYPCPDSDQRIYKNIWHFAAPPSFTNFGDLSALTTGAGGRLQFRLMTPSHSGRVRSRRGDVVIKGASAAGTSVTISRSLDGFPLPTKGSGWHSYSVIMRPRGWRIEPSGADVDTATFEAVLGSVSDLLIRGDIWVYGSTGAGQETVYLNNVTLTTSPA
jgi:hypothetical protein